MKRHSESNTPHGSAGWAALFLLLVFAATVAGWSAQPSVKPHLPQLIDVTGAAGIHFVHRSDPQKKYIVESMSGGVLLIDYDRDGWPDIYFTNAPSVAMARAGEKAKSALYRNNHDGTFTDVTDQAGVGYPCEFPMGGAVGDNNNDGWPDILVTCLGGVVLYRNNGNGTFTDVTKQAGLRDPYWASGAAFGDYDGDGWDDLFISDYVDFHLNDLPKFGSMPTCLYRGIPVQCGPRGLKGSPDFLFHNNGDGTFTDVSKTAGVANPNGYYGLGAVWTDLNNKGLPDLYVADDTTPNYLYRNDGHGHFTNISFASGTALDQNGSEQGSMGIAVGDYLHTGLFSLFITNFSEQYDTLYRNDGNLSFSDVSWPSGVAAATVSFVGWGTGFFDFDNDGWADLLAVNGHVYPQVQNANVGTKYLQPMLLYLNRHNGTFRNISKDVGPAIQVPRVSRGAAFGDLFNDGNIDIVVEDLDGAPVILRNPGGTGNHWISFQLEGTKANRLALGARVQVVAGKLVEADEVRSGGSYLSQNDLRLHFGLGNADDVDRVEIRWPIGLKGEMETLRNLAADRFYTIKEGAGVVAVHSPGWSKVPQHQSR